MPDEKRRILTEEQKSQLLEKHKLCYICQGSLAGYDTSEIQFDHIFSYAEGHDQELSNFAPVHASADSRKLNCHAAKGRKRPIEYREELRIKKALRDVTGLKDVCPKAIMSDFSISEDRKSITFNGTSLPLYNQQLGSKDHFYFFHEIEIKYIENDDAIQLRPLEPKILPLIFNLKQAVQLLPSLGRLDPITKTIKIFDGQHKAVAQIIGNNKKKIQCLVFVAPDIDELRVVIYQAHTDFVQQRYKKSHIDAKLADIYNQKIEAYRKRVGDPNARFSEADILRGESTAIVRGYLLAWIIDEVGEKRPFIKQYAAEDRTAQKKRPLLWQSLERMVKAMCRIDPMDKTTDDAMNYRADEIENFCFLIDQIEEYSLKNKWEPENPDSKGHQLARTYYYKTAFNNWIAILDEALRFALSQMQGAKVYDALCYRPAFEPEVRNRFVQIARKLFEHPLWVQESIQSEIAKTNQDSVVAEIFKREGLDFIYLTKL